MFPLLGRMDRDLRRGKRKDQPSTARIHRVEAEDLSKEDAVGLGITAVDKDVCTREERLHLSSSPPHVAGSTSARVSEKVHWCPAKSSAVYCRSPYTGSVGSSTKWAPLARARSPGAFASSTRTTTE